MRSPTPPVLITLFGGGQEVIRDVGADIHVHRRNHLVEQHAVNKKQKAKVSESIRTSIPLISRPWCTSAAAIIVAHCCWLGKIRIQERVVGRVRR